jgi:hypothetical protein
MPVTNNFVRVGEESVVCKIIEGGKTYSITPGVFKDNIRMGMIAVQQGFPSVGGYYHRIFQPNESSFEWIAQQDGINFALLYFYVLLPWEQKSGVIPGPITYHIGDHDGDKVHTGDIPTGQAAILQVEYLETPPTNGKVLSPYDSGQSYILPADFIETVPGYYEKIMVSTVGGKHYSYANFHLAKANANWDVESNARVHVLAGGQWNDIIGLMKTGKSEPGYLQLNQQGGNSMDLFALVAPAKVTNGSDGTENYVFQLGDPEKDGSVGVRKV